MMKAQDGAHNNTRKLYYFNKLLSDLKFNSSQTGLNIQRKHKKFRAQQNEVIIDNDSSVDNFTYTTTTTIAQPTITIQSDYTTMYPITTPFQLTSPATVTALVTPSTSNGTKHDNSKTKKDKSYKSRRKQVIWGAWHPWSECSRTCGSGVMSQNRDCIR